MPGGRAATKMQTRTFVFTNYAVDSTDYKKALDTVGNDIMYIAYGLETCPKTERQHHQGWICFKTKKSASKPNMCKLARRFAPGAHMEPMMGRLIDSDKYCSKENELITFGERPKQGDRNDLADVLSDIRCGKRKADDVLLEDPAYFHMYGRTLRAAEDVLLRQRYRTEMTTGLWLYGDTGVGKSHRALAGFTPETHYVKPLEDQWWDGYTGQEVVILNDFRGQLKYSELLTLVDKWPHSVKRRCREPAPFLAKQVIVTSSQHPEMVYSGVAASDSIEQLLRRFEVVELTKQEVP